MEKRGRKSAAELAIVSPIEVDPRPAAPSDLTDEQAAEWDACVSRMSATHFSRENQALLLQYCRHVVSAKRVAQMIEDHEQGELDLDAYDKLLKMQEREGRAISSLATRMRLTQQSRFDPKKKITKKVRGPWQE